MEHFISPIVMAMDGNTLGVKCTKEDSSDSLAELKFGGREIPSRCRNGQHEVHRGACVNHMRDRCRNAREIRYAIAVLAKESLENLTY